MANQATSASKAGGSAVRKAEVAAFLQRLSTERALAACQAAQSALAGLSPAKPKEC